MIQPRGLALPNLGSYIERETAEFVTACAEQLQDLPEPGVVTYRSDQEYHAAHPDIAYPASWHRAVVARIAQEVPGLVICYASDVAADQQ